MKRFVSILLLLIYLPVYAGTFFSDNFDSVYTPDVAHSGNFPGASTKGWNEAYASSPSTHEIDSARYHSAPYSRKTVIVNDGNLSHWAVNFSATNTLYVSYWVYFDSAFDWTFTAGGAGDGASEIKWGRYFKDPFGTEGNLGLISQHIWPTGRNGACPNGPCMEWAAPWIDDLNHVWHSPDTTFNNLDGGWHKLEFYYAMNTSGQANGTMMYWIDGVKQTIKCLGTGATMSDNGFAFHPTGVPFVATWAHDNINGYPSPYATFWIDDYLLSTTIGGGADTDPPAVMSVTVSTSGTTLAVNYNEPVSGGTSGNGGFTITPSGGAATLTYASGSNSSTLYYTISRAIQYYETLTIAYTKPGSVFVEDLSGNDLVSPIPSAVTNYSTQGGTPPTVTFPFSNANPIIGDNDEYDDVYVDDYLMALASTGAINLKGLITSSSITPYNQYVTSADFERMHADRTAAYNAAVASGMTNIPAPVTGVKGHLSKPLSGVIDDTVSIGSTGSELIVAEANLASVAVPLVVIAGGPLTTIADAYLIDNTIVDKVIVAYLGDSVSGFDNYNGWADGWAANIVLQKFKMVIFPVVTFYDTYTPIITKSELLTLPSSTWSTLMYNKQHSSNNLPNDQDADGPPAIAIMLGENYALTTQNVEYSSLQNLTLEGNAHEVPMFSAGGSSSIRVITADRALATNEWWRAVRASLQTPPLLSNLSPSGAVLCTEDPLPIIYTLNTNVDATCRGSLTNTTYDLMGAGATFDTTGAKAHTSTAYPGVACGGTFTLYVHCRDVNGMTTITPGIISSSVLVPNYAIPRPIKINPGGTVMRHDPHGMGIERQ
jgi:hypothetical protein